MKAKIGIVICGFMDNRQFVTDTYIRAIHKANGLPILLPMVRSNLIIQDYASLCDGFLFCGGDDITPLLFGEEPAKRLGKTDAGLDLFQIRLMQAVLDADKPILAICRGMQILNVALGGSIYQDLSLAGETINHMQTSASRQDASHKVTFTAGSRMQRIFGDFTYTNSFHHQSVNQLGAGLIATGHTGDGMIEAMERPGLPFTVGVQWHPECMLQKNDKMLRLFQFLVHHSA